MSIASSTEEPRRRRTPSKDADVAVGLRVHMLIWRGGRTQESIAVAAGIEPTAFGKKLKGKNRWALQELLDVARELETTVSFLVGETEDPHPASPNEGRVVGPAGIEPTTSTVKTRRGDAEVIPLFGRAA